MKRIKQYTFIFSLLSISAAHADNLYTDTFLQAVDFNGIESGWSISTKLGINEGSGEIQPEGFRLEAPRLTYQTVADNKILFRATVPWVYAKNPELKTFTIGDPSFFTSLKTSQNSSITIGVTEPAANRPLSPDVVRFMAFYTATIKSKNLIYSWQIGTEIVDRYNNEGQDDILSYAGSITLGRLTATALKKQVVDGHWWDITNPVESNLNRLNITLSHPLFSSPRTRLFYGVQYNENIQWVIGAHL